MTPKLLNIILIVSSVLLYNFIVSPLYTGGDSSLFDASQGIDKLIVQRNTYDKTIAALPGIFAEAEKDTKEYQAISQEDRQKILVMVPTEINDIKLMSELTNMGIDSGIPIDSMGVKDKGNGEYTVGFNIFTTYSKFKKVMAYWEKSMRLFRLNSVTFSPGKTEEENTKFTVDLTAFYMK